MLSRFVLHCVVLHFFADLFSLLLVWLAVRFWEFFCFISLSILAGNVSIERTVKKLGKGRAHDVKMAAVNVTHISLESSKCSLFFVFRSVHVNELLSLFFIYFSFTSFCVVFCRSVAYFCALLHICSVFSSFSFAFCMYLSSFHSTLVIVSLLHFDIFAIVGDFAVSIPFLCSMLWLWCCFSSCPNTHRHASSEIHTQLSYK